MLDLDAIEARANAAPPGPWCVEGTSYDEDGEEVLSPWGLAVKSTGETLWSSGAGEYTHPNMPTAQFIAAAREDVPALVAELRAAVAALATAERERDEARDRIDVLNQRHEEDEAYRQRAQQDLAAANKANEERTSELRDRLRAMHRRAQHAESLCSLVRGELSTSQAGYQAVKEMRRTEAIAAYAAEQEASRVRMVLAFYATGFTTGCTAGPDDPRERSELRRMGVPVGGMGGQSVRAWPSAALMTDQGEMARASLEASPAGVQAYERLPRWRSVVEAACAAHRQRYSDEAMQWVRKAVVALNQHEGYADE